MNEFLIPIFSAFFATLGYTLFYNIRGKNIIIASLCGAFSWAVYLVVKSYTHSLVLPFMAAGAAVALYSELAAYIFCAPAIVFLIPGFIPLVPGLTIFRTMQSALNSDVAAFGEGLITTIKIGAAIVLGLILMSSIIRLIRSSIGIIKEKQKAR